MSRVTRGILERVVRITLGDGATASGTIIERNGGVYVTTVAHALTDPTQPFRVSNHSRRRDGVFRFVEGVNPAADIAVFRVPDDWAMPDLPIELCSDHVEYSEEAFFLGFPFGYSFRSNPADGLPFIKRAIVSAVDFAQPGGATIFYLDGIDNVGFSGGPVLVQRINALPKVFGVVSGYVEEWLKLRTPDEEPQSKLGVDSNAGIIMAYDVRYALEAIDANPVPAPT